MKRGALVKLALFSVFALALGSTVYGTLMGPAVGTTATYHAMFVDGSGLRDGDQVRVAGVPVGRISKVALVDAHTVKVTFTANKNQKITSNTHVAIRYANLIGARFLALTQAKPGGEELRPGDTIPAERTVPALSLTALFNGFRPLFAALDPNQINDLASEVVAVLQGQSGTIESLLRHVASLTTDLAEKDQVFLEIVDGLSQVLRVGAAHDQDLVRILESFQQITSQLNAGGEAIVNAIASTSAMAQSLNSLVTGLNQNHLSDNVTNLALLAAKLAEIKGPLDQTLKGFPAAFTIFNRVTQNANAASLYPCLLSAATTGTPSVSATDLATLSGRIPPELGALIKLLPVTVPVPLVVPTGPIGNQSNHTAVCR